MKLTSLLPLFAILFVFSSEAQETETKKLPENLIEISPNIYMLKGKGGNIGLSIGDDGVFMIDDQYANGIAEVQETIKNITEKEVQFLINTHHHGDHTGGNVAMAESGATIFAHDNVRKRLENMIAMSTEKGETTSEKVLPVVTFSEDITFHYNENRIFVFHIHNAHTDGDAAVYFTDSNVLHTGDVFFNGRYPYIDLKSGGSVAGYIEALDRMLQVTNADTKVIPGHGDPGTTADMRFTKEMLKDLLQQVKIVHEAGSTEDEILKMKEITAKYDALDYGSGFINTEKMLQTVYAEVSKN